MRRKKEHGHVNHERWLVSYADFITLLFAFFVVLFASSQADKNKQAQVAAAMQMAFTPLGSFDAHAKTPPLEATPGSSSITKPAALALPFPQAGKVTPAEETMESGLNRMIRQAATKLPEGSITMRDTPEGLVISLHEIGFFASGSAEIRKESIPMLTTLATMLPDSPLRIEGHTDNVPIHTLRYSSNWELSTARASMIARFLLEHGTMHPNHLAAAGYAEFHPAVSNATAQGRSQNRRVDIILLRSPTLSR